MCAMNRLHLPYTPLEDYLRIPPTCSFADAAATNAPPADGLSTI
jgi:hypothetical protein